MRHGLSTLTLTLTLLPPALAVLFAALLCAVALLISGDNPLTALGVMITQVGEGTTAVDIVNSAAVYYLAALAVAIGFQMKLFNIGIEGQYRLAACVAAIVGGAVALPPVLHTLVILLVAALILTVLVKGFLIQAFFIPSRSMEPTLDVGDRVVVNRLAYRLGDPSHGQVVVFLRPTGADQTPDSGPISWVRRAVAQGLGGTPPGNEDLIKRVVGLPGDVLEVLPPLGHFWT